MDCRECQKKFIPFIDDQLSVPDLADFLHHMSTCEDCREEYDIYYSMIMGMRYLDEDQNLSITKLDSNVKLHSAADYLVKYKILRIEKYMLLGIICLGMVLLL